MTAVKTDLVLSFEKPHRIGSVCRHPCAQCDPSGTAPFLGTWGVNGETLPPQPLLIVAEATKEDWVRSIRSAGGTPVLAPQQANDRFYFVTTD